MKQVSRENSEVFSPVNIHQHEMIKKQLKEKETKKVTLKAMHKSTTSSTRAAIFNQ